ncbi:DUF4129 domain-containing protein [Microbacterium esteraromaticum]|nr:DUF4129 domain-containing protein [Microbacterium esteraromaticum]
MTVSTEQGRRGRSPRSSGRSAIAQVAALGLFVVAIAAAALAGLPTFSAVDSEAAPREGQKALQTPTFEPSPPPAEPQEPNLVLMIIGIVLLAVAVTLVLIAIIRLARRLLAALRDRMRALPEAAETEVETATAPSPEEPLDATAVQRGIAVALSSIAAHRDPGDAIVTAWLGLEETASDAGAGRGRSETPAEFTVRILTRRPGIDEPARILLRLYEQVRFGSTPADERMRREAERALAAIERGWR